MEKLRVLDLFSGIGGFSLGLESTGGFETVAFCEIEGFPQKILKKHWADVPIFNDVRTICDEFKPTKPIDVICGGFPCQPYSVAGKQKGKEDNRDLWPAMFDVIKEYKPSWVIGENVANFANMEFERTALDLESQGYEVQAFIIPACAYNLPHRRDRIWIIAYSEDKRWDRWGYKFGDNQKKNETRLASSPKRPDEEHTIISSDANNERTKIPFDREQSSEQLLGSSITQRQFWWEWEVKPTVCGENDELSYRVDRIKSLGNAVVPGVVAKIGTAILATEYELSSLEAI